MGLLSSIELPHWLMIVGAVLIAIGFLGLAFTRKNKEAATPEPPLSRPKMPPLPKLLDSSSRKNNQ
jgi:LPXTG-motif cell wall-anchored protein